MLDFFIRVAEIYHDLIIVQFLLFLYLPSRFARAIPEELLSPATDADFYLVYGYGYTFCIIIWVARILQHAVFILTDCPAMGSVAASLEIFLLLYSLFLMRTICHLLSLKPGALKETKIVLIITPFVHTGAVALAILAAHYLTYGNLKIPDHQFKYLDDLFQDLRIINWLWLLYFFFSKRINALWKLIDDPQKGARQPGM